MQRRRRSESFVETVNTDFAVFDKSGRHERGRTDGDHDGDADYPLSDHQHGARAEQSAERCSSSEGVWGW
jgi:hypothetical protein